MGWAGAERRLQARVREQFEALLRRRFEPPQFCRTPLLFTSLVAAELVVVVLWLAQGSEERWSFRQFFAISAMALWLALACAVLLCKSRSWLKRWPLLPGALLCWLLPVAAVALGSWMVQQFDLLQPLGSEYSTAGSEHFAARSASIAAVLYAFLLRYFYVQEQWLRNERAQARAAVDALQARIRPHFLFNSMNSIASLVRRDPVTAERAIEDLADLFRAALGAGEGVGSLGEELALCRAYLDIEKLRLAERLQVELHVQDGVPMQAVLPRLILQPLVENAIHHGIARLPKGGTLAVQVSSRGGDIVVLITNPLPAAATGGGGNQHAWSNIEQRLAYHFADRARVERCVENGEYRVTLRVPKTASPISEHRP